MAHAWSLWHRIFADFLREALGKCRLWESILSPVFLVVKSGVHLHQNLLQSLVKMQFLQPHPRPADPASFPYHLLIGVTEPLIQLHFNFLKTFLGGKKSDFWLKEEYEWKGCKPLSDDRELCASTAAANYGQEIITCWHCLALEPPDPQASLHKSVTHWQVEKHLLAYLPLVIYLRPQQEKHGVPTLTQVR